jgi:hypothetical protein
MPNGKSLEPYYTVPMPKTFEHEEFSGCPIFLGAEMQRIQPVLWSSVTLLPILEEERERCAEVDNWFASRLMLLEKQARFQGCLIKSPFTFMIYSFYGLLIDHGAGY